MKTCTYSELQPGKLYRMAHIVRGGESDGWFFSRPGTPCIFCVVTKVDESTLNNLAMNRVWVDDGTTILVLESSKTCVGNHSTIKILTTDGDCLLLPEILCDISRFEEVVLSPDNMER